ncbi:MAG: hypothetical protein HY694_16185 [Deltaproteobacteria bacterium]|jgi:hypothetical protein|nr:hypothetical protein [Deltaproteobacteria bacterium]
MEKKALLMFSLIGILLLSAPSAWARTCPKLIKEGQETLAKVKLTKADEDKVKALLGEAQKLHDNGSHAASVKKANEALDLLKKK